LTPPQQRYTQVARSHRTHVQEEEVNVASRSKSKPPTRGPYQPLVKSEEFDPVLLFTRQREDLRIQVAEQVCSPICSDYVSSSFIIDTRNPASQARDRRVDKATRYRKGHGEEGCRSWSQKVTSLTRSAFVCAHRLSVQASRHSTRRRSSFRFKLRSSLPQLPRFGRNPPILARAEHPLPSTSQVAHIPKPRPASRSSTFQKWSPSWVKTDRFMPLLPPRR
jgi:hypothetical protein